MDDSGNVARDEKLFLHDPYLAWCEGEGLPIVEDFGVHLPAVEVARWPRLDVDGAFVHLKGRGDWLAVFVISLPPGAKTAPQKHMYEEVHYVLSGHGSTTVELPDGSKHSFEWGPKSLFALPLNCSFQHFNGSGQEPARLSSTNNLPMVLNLFHQEKFVFDNPCSFAERIGNSDYFTGEGEFIPKQPGRHMWETNFVPALDKFELKQWDARGGGSSNIMFVLADGTMHAHSSEMPVGTYKKAHRHGADFHVMCVTGNGYSLLWYEDDEFERIDWEHGTVFAPPDMMFHQHFNTSPAPSRYLAIACGGLRYPLMAEKRAVFSGMDVDVKKGGAQIEYGDQNPNIHKIYLGELKKNGAVSNMGEMIDESRHSV